jgi:gliding motility-associated-like protein
MKLLFLLNLILLFSSKIIAQNSMVGDGFGGRLWYKPYNYTVGSYSAYTICGEEKQLYGWGSNKTGQLGDGTYNSTITPVKCIGMKNLKYYSTGYVMGAIKDDNTGWIWGQQNPNPTKIIDDVKFVDAGANNSAFVKNDGTVWSVGVNYYGEYGNGHSQDPFSLIPQKMLNINNAVRTAQGGYSTTVLLNDGSLLIAGKFNSNIYLVPEKVVINNFIVDIKANVSENLALDSSGNVWYWNTTKLPYKIYGVKNVVAISGSNDGDHFLILDENHDCFSLGNNFWGQCGINNAKIDTPIKVASNVNDIMAGETFSYIIKTNSKLYASGMSTMGSIWLNIENKQRFNFTEIDPTETSINLCGTSNSGEFGEIIVPVPEVDTPIVFFPNAFTPNGDGKNDFFKAICSDKSKIENFDLKVVNRYGTVVFQTNDIDKSWNGFRADLSTYFYYCSYKKYNKRIQTVKGDVILLY